MPKVFGKLRDMPSRDARRASADQLKQLGAAVKHRREQELDMRQEDVQAAGGPSTTTLSKLEAGEGSTPSRTTLERLDKGLRWERGSARACLWNGTAPTPLPELSGDRARRLLAAAPAEARGGPLRRLRVLRDELDEIIEQMGGE